MRCINLVQVDSFQRDAMAYVKPNHGTTTLSFIFQGGIIVAADSRASSGSYICMPLPHCPLPSSKCSGFESALIGRSLVCSFSDSEEDH